LVKQCYDWAGAFLLVVLLLPLLLAIAIAIRIDDGGPALVRQTRVGRHGREFRLLKFRSTVAGCDPFAAEARISGVGAFLRRYSLDELPQLFNVLGGAMAVVGPRPLSRDEAPADGLHVRRRLLVKPGLTGLWLVGGGDGVLSWDESAHIDVRYMENWSPALDLLVLRRTLGAVYGAHDTY
jgi:lipopolysaccharide/colanic/teichoic acid biosynthesis glycosyltransferase